MATPCLHSRDNPAPKRRGRDQLRQAAFSPKANTRVAKRLGFHEVKANLKATVALPGTDVNLAGRAPARLAVHCILATGGPGAATPHAPFGRPRRPLGTFPRGESTSSARRRTKPLTRNRFLVGGKGKELTFFFMFRRGFRLCGGDQRAFRSPFGNLRRPPVEADGSRKK